MTIVASTTLTANAEHTIADALRSVVDRVDLCVVIDTGATDRTLDIAGKVAKQKLRLASFPWVDNFAAARNFALTVAREHGADWALTLDTDERLRWAAEPWQLHKALDQQTASVLLVEHVGRTYSKERLFRLPASGWRGPTHEAFCGAGDRATLPGVRFEELEKTPAELRNKLERDERVLRDYSAQHPQDPRWLFYLGQTLADLERWREAAATFDACAALWGWDEEAAWACFSAAQCRIRLGKYHAGPGDTDLREAVETCARGLAHHPGIAELAWLAAFASYHLGNDDHAEWWSRLALAHGMTEGDGASVKRIGFRHPVGLWEGPHDVIRCVALRRGDHDAAARAYVSWTEARAARDEHEAPR